MIAVLQRCSRANVKVNQNIVGQIGNGLVILLGVQKDDNEEDADDEHGFVVMSRYNNAFRFNKPQRGSVGLGGNIAKSLFSLKVCVCVSLCCALLMT